MRRGDAFGLLATLLSVCAMSAAAQPTLPPTAVSTAAPSPSAVETPAASPPARQAQVSYQMGQLTVITENSSLEAILRDIAGKTGMKITGSIADERVYGTYGPAAPSSVLALLLNGSGNDMVLRESAAAGPVELVLTPAQAMPSTRIQYTPPAASVPPAPPPQYQPQPNYYPPRPPQSYQPPPQQQLQYGSQPQPVYSQGSGNQPSGLSQPADQTQPAGASLPQSPNGVPTPQQIYEQLQRLQQQRAQPQASAH